MVQSYLSYPFHANTHTYTHFFSPSPLLASTARLGDSYKRRVIRRKDCTAERGENGTCSPLPSPFSPCLPGRSIKPVSMGAQSPPTLFRSGHLPREREEEIGGAGEREREARTETRPVYKWARSVSLCVEIKSKRGAWLGLGRGRANFLRFLANRFSPRVSGCSVCAPPRWDIPAFSCRLIRYTPPHIGEEAQRLLFRDAFFFFFFYGKSSFFFLLQ